MLERRSFLRGIAATAVLAAVGPVKSFAAQTTLSETDAFLSTLSAAPSAGRMAAINQMIANLKAEGVWSKLDALYLFGDAENEQQALVNWRHMEAA